MLVVHVLVIINPFVTQLYLSSFMKGLIFKSYRDKNISVSLVLATKILDIISVSYHLPLLIGHVINSDK